MAIRLKDFNQADGSTKAKIDAVLNGAPSWAQKELQTKAKVARNKQSATTAANKILNSPNSTKAQIEEANSIVNPKKPSFFAGALGSIAGSPVGKGLMKGLDVVDTPRAAIVSGLGETSDLITDAFNLPGHEYVDASFGDFWNQAKDNVGFGDVYREKAAASAAAGDNSVFGIKQFENPELLKNAPKGAKEFKEWLKTLGDDGGDKLKWSSGGKIMAMGVGITGDIASDPFTYMTAGGSQLVGKSADAVSDIAYRLARREGLSAAEKKSYMSLAQKVQKTGKWSLSKDELALMGLAGEGGIHFRRPGTGALARKLPWTPNEAVISRAIPGTEAAMRYSPVGAYQVARGAVRGTTTGGKISKLLGGKYGEGGIRNRLMHGTLEEFENSFGLMQVDALANGWEKKFADDIDRQYRSLEERMRKSNVDPEDLWHALGDPTNVTDHSQRVIASGGADFLEEYRRFAHEVMPTAMNVHAGTNIVTPRAAWQPSLRPEEIREHLHETFGARKRGRGNGTLLPTSPAEFEAKLVANGEFMGEELLSAEDFLARVKSDPVFKIRRLGADAADEAMTPTQQAQRILEVETAKFGEDHVYALFETDITKAMPAVIRQNAHRVKTARMEVELIERGIAMPYMQAMLDTRLNVGKQTLAQAKRSLADMRLKQKVAVSMEEDLESRMTRLYKSIRNKGNMNRYRKRVREMKFADVLEEARKTADTELRNSRLAYNSAYRIEQNIPLIQEGVQDMLSKMDDLAYLNTPQYFDDLARHNELVGELAVAQRVVDDFAAERASLISKLAEVEDAGNSRIRNAQASIAARESMERRVAALEGHIADLTALPHSFASPEDYDFLVKRIRDVEFGRDLLVDKAGYLGQDAWRDTATTAVNVAELDAKLANNFWTDLSKLDPDEGLRLLGDVHNQLLGRAKEMRKQLDPEWMTTGQEILRTRAALDDLVAEAAAMGRDDLVEEYAALIARMPQSDGAVLVNSADVDGLWYLGDLESVDLSTAEGFAQAVDASENGIGLRLTQTPSTANEGGVIAKVTNPKVYGPEDPKLLALERNGSRVRVRRTQARFAANGTQASNSVREMRNDMLRDGWASGLLNPETMPSHQDKWRAVKRIMQSEKITFDAAVGRVFERDNVLGLKFRGVAAGGLPNDEWLMSQLADRYLGELGTLSADLRGKVTKSFRDNLSATHDAIVLPSANGQWQTIVLDPDSLVSKTGEVIPGIRTLQDTANEKLAKIMQGTDEINKAIAETGNDLHLAMGDLRNADAAVIDSSARLTELIDMNLQEAVDEVTDRLLLELDVRNVAEIRYEQASKHYAEAERIRSQALQQQDEIVRAAELEHAQISELYGQLAETEAIHNTVVANIARNNKNIAKLSKRIDNVEKRMARNLAATRDETKQLRDVRGHMDDFTKRSMRQISQDAYAPNYIAQAIEDMSPLMGQATGGTTALLKAVDKVTNLWKAQALTRPGFHVRNYMGGVVNNFIGGVDNAVYGQFNQRWKVYRKAIKGGADHNNAVLKVAEAFPLDDSSRWIDDIVTHGIVGGGQSTETKIIGGAHATNWKPWSQDFKGYRKNSDAMANVENRLRGAMAWDRLNKGSSMDAVFSDIARFHFDYDDLSSFERKVVRRIVPFYTWTRKNFPLQVEMALENPKHLTRFMNVKRNIEMVSEDEDVYPSWFDDNLNIRVPWKVGGNQMYVFPDMPWAKVGGATSVGGVGSEIMQQANPFLKVPLERMSGEKFFGNIPFKPGYQDPPEIWSQVGITNVLEMFGKAKRDANGQLVMRDKDIYTVEQWIPFLGQARRLAPSGTSGVPGVGDAPSSGRVSGTEAKLTDRSIFTWASFVFGQTARTVNQQDKSAEWYSRKVKLDEVVKDNTDLGYMGATA